jgi:hypothetical protein
MPISASRSGFSLCISSVISELPAYDSVIPAATATSATPRPRKKTNALLEPVLRDGLRPFPPGGTLEKTFAASRSFSPAVIRALREIFSFPSFEEIFDGHFRLDPFRVGSTRNSRCSFFRDASLVRPV